MQLSAHSTPAPQADERQFNRRSALTLAAVILFGLLVLTTTFYTLRMPGDGWQMIYLEPPLAAFAGDWATPLQTGDLVVAVDGIDVRSAEEPLPRPPGWHSGSNVPYTVQRNGRVVTVDVPLQTLDARGIARALATSMVYDLPQWSWLIAGLIVFALRPGSAQACLLLLAGGVLFFDTKIGWAATMTSAGFTPPPIYYVDRLNDSFWAWILFPAIILFLLSFGRLWPLTRYPRLTTALIFLVPAAVALDAVLNGRDELALPLILLEGVLIVIAAIAAVVSAFRPGRDPALRAQVSWVALGVAVSIGGTLLGYLLDQSDLVELSAVGEALYSWLITLALPVCMGIAILRYRLFDIEVIIRKTLVYGVLTALLALLYFGLILLLRGLVDAAGGSQSTLTIVISTLAIAAAFAPLRRRLQTAIDRRFFRRKYDAQQVLEQYTHAVRDETDPYALRAEVERAVSEALQPAYVQVWLREDGT